MFIIAYPETLIEYESLEEAQAAAKERAEEMKLSVEILGVVPIETWDPPKDDDGDGPGDGERVMGTA